MLFYCICLAVLISNKNQSTRLISLDYFHNMVCWHKHQNNWEIVISNLAHARVPLLSIDNKYLEIGGFDIFWIYSTELGYCVWIAKKNGLCHLKSKLSRYSKYRCSRFRWYSFVFERTQSHLVLIVCILTGHYLIDVHYSHKVMEFIRIIVVFR